MLAAFPKPREIEVASSLRGPQVTDDQAEVVNMRMARALGRSQFKLVTLHSLIVQDQDLLQASQPQREKLLETTFSWGSEESDLSISKNYIP